MNNRFLSLMATAVIGLTGATTPLSASCTPEGGGMTPEILLSMARVGQNSLSPDGKTVVYAVSFPDIQANKITSDLFSVGMDGKGRKQLTNDPAGQSSPTWLAGGKRIAYLSNSSGSMQLWTMAADGTDLRQLTDVEGGIEGYLFSADEKQVVYIHSFKSTKTAADIHPDLPKATGRIVKDLMYKHWDEWVMTTPHIYLADVSEGSTIRTGKDLLEGEPYEAPMRPFGGVEDISFSSDGKRIAYASRKKTGKEYSISTNSDIFLYDIATGKTRNVSEGMMGYDTHPKFSPDGKHLAWISMEHDGYESDLKRLFVMDLNTGSKEWINPSLDLNVDELQWSADSKTIYFLATKQAETQLWSIEVKSRHIRQITNGQWDYTGFEVRGNSMLAARQSIAEPTDLYNVDMRTGKATAITAENRETLSKLAPISCEKRWITTTTGEKMLVWVILPPNFDKTKEYPSILYCQGGPQDPVSQFWSFRWNFRIMAEQGYVVIAPNRHGVPSFGQKWNAQISGDYGGQNMRDYMTAADEMKKESWIANDRMGCVGASYGGFSVYWLAGHNENKRFAVFISHAGIFDLNAQYLQTEELWFANWDLGGAPWEDDNKVAQRTYATSPMKFVKKWNAPIMIIHGELDYRILASQGMMAFNAAQLMGIPSEMLIFPDENHWILQPQNGILWQRSFFSWLDRWLK